ncbi:MAG: type II secretion system F family protein [Eggerthellaceae bacterium]|nr:type II secretion system F family protein [Eggerthellaceae bacterium]
MVATALPLFACASAMVAGALSVRMLVDRRTKAARQKTLKRGWQGADGMSSGGNLSDMVLARVVRFDMLRKGAAAPAWVNALARADNARIASKLRVAGLAHVSVENASLWRLRACAMGSLAGMLSGCMLTPFAALAGCLVGAAGGWALLGRALSARAASRKDALERHISEAIEVLCLGLRAGLSFERSLELYCDNFPTRLARELRLAQQVWTTGLLTREESLRSLASTYESAVLTRVVDAIVRSLRFGSPLAEGLDELANEARRSHRANVEERVMKAPVKMMLPVGMLILPSMMLLVMGPIMLELLEGF